MSPRRETRCRGWGQEGHHTELAEAWGMSLGTHGGSSPGREGVQEQEEACHPCPSFPDGVVYAASGISPARDMNKWWCGWTMAKKIWGLKPYHLEAEEGGDVFEGHQGQRIPRMCHWMWGLGGISWWNVFGVGPSILWPGRTAHPSIWLFVH